VRISRSALQKWSRACSLPPVWIHTPGPTSTSELRLALLPLFPSSIHFHFHFQFCCSKTFTSAHPPKNMQPSIDLVVLYERYQIESYDVS
jgi:hypothetical protein